MAAGSTGAGAGSTTGRAGESKHNRRPTPVLDVAFLLADGEVSWSGLLLSKFARLVKAADARMHWAATGSSLRTGRILRCREK